jgi:cytochrome c-type biogenesis protein CcmH
MLLPPTTRRRLALLLALWLALALLPATLGAQEATRVDKETFNSISDKLICQCGCNYGLRHCPHLQCPSAPVMRAAIEEELSAGLAEPDVIEAVVARFGPAALASPPAEGFDLTAWIMPFAALLIGLGLAVIVARRWRRRQPVAAAEPALVDRYRSQIDREMKHLEE